MSFLGDSETVQILFSVDEKLRLPDAPDFPVNRQSKS
jgi:hypothetical protein